MIAVDVGNTSVHCVWFSEGKIIRSEIVPTRDINRARLAKLIPKRSGEKVLVCSVVPRVTKLFKRHNRNVYSVGEDLRIPIKCEYNKKQIGQDRLIGAYSARILFPRLTWFDPSGS